MRTSLLPLLLGLCALAPAVRADYDDGYFPLAQGNTWTYAREPGGGQVQMGVDQVGTAGGTRYYRLRNYNGPSHWIRQTAAGGVYGGASATWYRFDAAPGQYWTFRVAGGGTVPGSNGARVTMLGQESVTVPAGTFQAVRLRWRAQAQDAGITDEWFARGVGLIKRTETSLAGPRTLVLVQATISGQLIAGGGGGGMIPVLTGEGAFGISGDVPAARVRLRVVLAQGLRRPAAMAVHPGDGSLWIVNRGDDSTTIVDGPGSPGMQARRYQDDSDHFMNNPLAIAFSRSRLEHAVALESINDYNGAAPGNYFTGPTLFSSDRTIFQGGASSHLDMLHHSPLAVGIAAGARPAAGQPDRREYWVFNGAAGCIDRYYFHEPHVLGGHDHADGQTFRYGGGLRRVANVPGHLVLDEAAGVLYIADTGNGRIARLDTQAVSLSQSYPINGYHAETPLRRVPGAAIQSVTAPGALERPAGLILTGGKLVVSDHATGKVSVFSPDGALLGQADTGLGAGALTGLCEVQGKLYLLDARGDRLLELTVLP